MLCFYEKKKIIQEISIKVDELLNANSNITQGLEKFKKEYDDLETEYTTLEAEVETLES